VTREALQTLHSTPFLQEQLTQTCSPNSEESVTTRILSVSGGIARRKAGTLFQILLPEYRRNP